MAYPKRILIVGNGGREGALANACLLSRDIDQLWITPANRGIVDLHSTSRVRTLDIAAIDHERIVAEARQLEIDLALIGPEDPICNGLADGLRTAGIAVVGPGEAAAQLEGSKQFAKQFMARHNIPTGAYREFSDAEALLEYCRQTSGPLVLKADGLAAGKGVIVCDTPEDSVTAATRLMVDREFGAAGQRVLAEERLFGREISFTCLVSGGQARLLGSSTDYKPLLDGDHGPNTGGMGNICPTPWATPAVVEEFNENILQPFEAGLAADQLDYCGFLFVGTMLTSDGLKVIEFNVRLGDPEAAVILPMYDADWPAVFAGVAAGQLDRMPDLKDGACVAVVLASENYPYAKSEPAEILGFDRIYNQGLLVTRDAETSQPIPGPVSVFFAGVSCQDMTEAGTVAGGDYQPYYDSTRTTRYLASGGRVLVVSATGPDLSQARRLAYEVVGNLKFNGARFRTDIGYIDEPPQ